MTLSFIAGGDIFESKCQTLVNPVNTVGVMGAGLAKRFKEKYPEMFWQYRNACCSGRLKIGGLLLWDGTARWVLCLPTKRHWRDQANLTDIEEALRTFKQGYRYNKITSAAFPALGCGLGGLQWDMVKPLMEHHLTLGIPIEIYAPQ